METLIGEREYLPIFDRNGRIRPPIEALAGLLDHVGRHVSSKHRAGRTHDPESCFRRYASSGRDIEHALPGRKLRGAQQERKEVGRDMREGSVIFGGGLRPVGKLIGHWHPPPPLYPHLRSPGEKSRLRDGDDSRPWRGAEAGSPTHE